MMKSRLIWLLWLAGMAAASVFTGEYLYMALLLISCVAFVMSGILLICTGRKLQVQIKLPRAAERGREFTGELQIRNLSILPVFGGKGKLWWENTLTGEKGWLPISLSLQSKGKQIIEFQGESSWCGCVAFTFGKWYCQDLFHIFSGKRQTKESREVVIMPDRQKKSFSFLLGEGFDMESFRYSGMRPGDDPGETYDIRSYRPGDNIRQIHWKLTGKLDDVMIREKSYPVDDTVLLLAESFQKDRNPLRAEAAAEVFAAILEDFMERKISCQAGVYDRSAGRIHIQKIGTREDLEKVLYLFLQSTGTKDEPVVVRKYLENPGTVRFAEYIYLTGEPEDISAQFLKNRGQVTVLKCGGKGSDSEGVQITWKFGLQCQDKNKKQNTDSSCPVFCWKLG
ncbi:MAG: DUF58 domain-containing protein [Blautia sp.]|nr:DUF58 domain-containing protein [Blautia sp.]